MGLNQSLKDAIQRQMEVKKYLKQIKVNLLLVSSGTIIKYYWLNEPLYTCFRNRK